MPKNEILASEDRKSIEGEMKRRRGHWQFMGVILTCVFLAVSSPKFVNKETQTLVDKSQAHTCVT